MADKATILTGGSNSFQTTAEHLNYPATDFIADGVIGAITNTSGVAPMTGGLAVNAQGSPNMTVAVTAGVCYVTATPTGQASQRIRANIAAQNVTIASNSTGSTRYDHIYVTINATNANTPNAAGDNVASITQSRSTSSSTDNGTPPTYGYKIAVVTVVNGAASISNGSIADSRTRTGATNIDTSTASNNVITAPMLSTSAITLGYTQITSTFTTPSSSTTAVQVTGLTSSVTVPAGGRKVKISAWTGYLSASGAPKVSTLEIWDGTVGSGTRLAKATVLSNVANNGQSCFVQAIVTPSAGAKTYNVGATSETSQTTSVEASSTSPAYILVELI